jgi:hypothetical protein
MLVNDLAWVPFVGMTVPFLMMPLSVAAAGLLDVRAEPVFPRWACYYSLAASAIVMPSGLITFFRSGPLAWNGVLGWWVPVTDFFIWYVVMFFLLRSAIRREAADEGITS